MEKKRNRPPHAPLCGRHPLTLGSVSLLGLSGYELWVRLEDFWAWTRGIRHLSRVRKTPFLEDLAIIFEAPEMRQLGLKLLFLALAVVFALVCIFRRNRPRGAWLLLLLDGALAGTGAWLGLYSLHPTDWAQGLKLAPMALVAVGCVMNIAHDRALATRRPDMPPPENPPGQV